MKVEYEIIPWNLNDSIKEVANEASIFNISREKFFPRLFLMSSNEEKWVSFSSKIIISLCSDNVVASPHRCDFLLRAFEIIKWYKAISGYQQAYSFHLHNNVI